jgi:hypothetical protein
MTQTYLMLNRYLFLSCVRTLSQSLMRLVMARSAAHVACFQLPSSCPANVVSISRAHGPWLSPSSSTFGILLPTYEAVVLDFVVCAIRKRAGGFCLFTLPLPKGTGGASFARARRSRLARIGITDDSREIFPTHYAKMKPDFLLSSGHAS